jgi:hypothetical protein
MIAHDYARALDKAGANKKNLKSLREALGRRGHEKLLPQIFAEYQKIVLHRQRLALHQKATPQKERTRVLLELYRKLTHHA